MSVFVFYSNVIIPNIVIGLFFKVKELTPQVSHAAKILLDNPEEDTANQHFDKLKEEWVNETNRLTDAIDATADTLQLIEACGKSTGLDRGEGRVVEVNPPPLR